MFSLAEVTYWAKTNFECQKSKCCFKNASNYAIVPYLFVTQEFSLEGVEVAPPEFYTWKGEQTRDTSWVHKSRRTFLPIREELREFESIGRRKISVCATKEARGNVPGDYGSKTDERCSTYNCHNFPPFICASNCVTIVGSNDMPIVSRYMHQHQGH